MRIPGRTPSPPRLHAAGADLGLVYRVDVEQNGTISQLTLPLDCSALATEISSLGAVLLAADPLLSLIHSSIDTHRDRDLRTALEPLVALADSTGCAVVGLAHFNKSDSSDALNLITGSRAFSAVARAVIAIARDTEAEDGSCVLSQAKNNLGRLDLPSLRYVIDSIEVATEEGPASVGRVRFSGESPRSVTDILREGRTDEESRAERHAAADWLVDYLTQCGGQAPWVEIRKAPPPGLRASPTGPCNEPAPEPASAVPGRGSAPARCGGWTPTPIRATVGRLCPARAPVIPARHDHSRPVGRARTSSPSPAVPECVYPVRTRTPPAADAGATLT